MTTIKETLLLPELQDVIIRAGKGGEIRRIRWAHVMDTVEVAHFLEGGEMLLTSGKVWPSNLGEEKELLESLKEIQISGIIFATGHYIEDCPQAAMEYGEQYKIPILEMPFQTPFIKITQAVNRAVLDAQYKKAELIEGVSYEVTEKLRVSTNYKELCNVIANLFNCTVFLTSPGKKFFTQVFSDHQHINIPQLIENLMEELSKKRAHIHSSQTGVQIIELPNMSYPKTIAIPLEVEDSLWGVLWLIGWQPIVDQDKILKYTATLLTDHYLNQRESEVRNNYLKTEILHLLLKKPNIASKILEAKMSEGGFKETTNYLIGIVDVGKESDPKVLTLEKIRESLQELLDNTKKINGFCHYYDKQIVLLLSSVNNIDELKIELKDLLYYLNKTQQQSVRILFGRIKNDIKSLDESYWEAKSLTSLSILNNKNGLFFADDLNREMLLYNNFNGERATELRNEILPDFFFTEQGKPLYETLKTLAQNDFNREKVAEILHIHRNTLRYRIEKVENLLGSSLSSSRCRFWVQIALDLEI